jgi:hypothetical protein|eukprot:COSAG06_NODE_4335_length_4357_cov_120.961954_3_plen_90_part_00
MGKLQNTRIFEKHELTISGDFKEASFELLAQAHTKEYLDFVQTLSDEVAANGEAVPFTPHVQVLRKPHLLRRRFMLKMHHFVKTCPAQT